MNALESGGTEGVARTIDQRAAGAKNVDERSHQARTVSPRRQDRHEKERLDNDPERIEKLGRAEVHLRVKEGLAAAKRSERLLLKRHHEPEQASADEIERRGEAAGSGVAPCLVQAAGALERVLD